LFFCDEAKMNRIRPTTPFLLKASLLLLVAPVLLLPFPVVGQTQAQTQTQTQTHAQMNQTSMDLFQSSDKELNAMYAKLKQKLPAARRDKLIAAQRAWLAFRDAHAAFVASEAQGGSMYPTLLYSTRAALTQDRIRQLRTPGFGPQP
jgi:uncharacterized protein YecT (DUF1311 family)